MFHKAIELEYGNNTIIELTFQNGEVKQFDMKRMFDKYPQFEKLNNREFFVSGKLSGGYGIIWDDKLDIETETIFEEGTTVRTVNLNGGIEIGEALMKARAEANLTQKQLADLTGIDQSDISKIERGVSNPSVSTLKRLAEGMGLKLVIDFKKESRNE